MYNEIPSKNLPCRGRGEGFSCEQWGRNEGHGDRTVRGANVNCGKSWGGSTGVTTRSKEGIHPASEMNIICTDVFIFIQVSSVVLFFCSTEWFRFHLFARLYSQHLDDTLVFNEKRFACFFHTGCSFMITMKLLFWYFQITPRPLICYIMKYKR